MQKLLCLKFGEELPSDVLERFDSANDDQINCWIERILTASEAWAYDVEPGFNEAIAVFK